MSPRTVTAIVIGGLAVLIVIAGGLVGLSGVFTDPGSPVQARVVLQTEDDPRITAENVGDIVAGLLREGDDITLVYDDNAGSLTVSTAASGTGLSTADVTVTAAELAALGTTRVQLISAPAAGEGLWFHDMVVLRAASGTGPTACAGCTLASLVSSGTGNADSESGTVRIAESTNPSSGSDWWLSTSEQRYVLWGNDDIDNQPLLSGVGLQLALDREGGQGTLARVTGDLRLIIRYETRSVP